MNNRILVTYATRAGSTLGVADAIALGLRKRGFLVTVRPMKENPDVKGYQAVIAGSAIRQGAWLPEAITFLMTHQAALRRVRVAVFTVHMNNTGDDAQSLSNRQAYLDQVHQYVHPVAEVFFKGKIDPKRLTLFDRLMVRVLKAPVGDFRDWTQVRGWAQEVLEQEIEIQ